MKKILFWTYVYPYGYYNASAGCSVRIMKALSEDTSVEVHCVSYQQIGDKQPYKTIPNVVRHPINLKASPIRSRWRSHLQILLRIPIYPIFSFLRIFKHYVACRDICKEHKFDLVVSQFHPEDSAFVGALLRKLGWIEKHCVLYWDNIYGKKGPRFIPKGFALRRKIWAEGFINRNAEKIISLYPIKPFHEMYGDLPGSAIKRSYLGIPSIIAPEKAIETKYISVIKDDMINILYSGSIIIPSYVSDIVNILNQSTNAKKINLIFFSKGFSEAEFDKMRSVFKGTIQSPGYIPVDELHSVYLKSDIFLSLPGEINSIRSKNFEYMSYGHPMIVLYDNPEDVNAKVFNKYPYCMTINLSLDAMESAESFDGFIATSLGRTVPFDVVQSLFVLDTPHVYVELFKKMI